MHRSVRSFLAVLVLIACATVRAELKMPNIFTDGAILQRNVEAPIWGIADANEKITVKLGDKSVNATAGADGKWMAKLPQMAAGGPHEISIEGSSGKKITIKNVLFGEVWVCSGQSNMEMNVGGSDGAKEAVEAAKDSQLRMFTVTKLSTGTPQADCTGKWEDAVGPTINHFSAAAYYFGVELRKELNVPVGLFHTSWGGTPAEAWTSPEGLAKMDNCKGLVESWEKRVAGFDEAKAKEAYDKRLKDWETAVAKAKEEKTALPKKPNFDDPRSNPWRTAGLYNGMIAPLVPYGIAGSIWYQGESNCGRAQQYRTLFPGMIQSWRTAWNMPEMPFYFVQIAPYKYGVKDGAYYPELCEAQTLTLKMPNTGMAVISDIGNVKDIHPKNKKGVGQRLALWALAKTYGKKELVYSGPLYKEAKVEGDKIRISFDHVGGGLVSRDGKDLTQFTICGEDQKFEPATATIEGATVVVKSDKVAKPVAVRYAWHETAEGNLMNKEGLPASLFRTDDFKMATDGKNQ